MADRIVAKIASMAPNFPDLMERQFNYPAYTYELMFGCTGGDFTHGLLQPEFMGPFRPGPAGVARQCPSRSKGCTSAGRAATGARESPSSPATTAATPCSRTAKLFAVVADLALHERQVEGHRERQAGEQAHHEEDPRRAQPRRLPSTMVHSGSRTRLTMM